MGELLRLVHGLIQWALESFHYFFQKLSVMAWRGSLNRLVRQAFVFCF